jgi:Ca-activated chloride channel family protein
MPLDVDLSAARIPEIDPQGVLLRVAFSAPPAPARQRRPAQFGLLIDRSSSMSGAPLASAVDAAQRLVARLEERDRLTLVAFDGHAVVLADALPMEAPQKEQLTARLSALVPGVGTNIGAAVNAGIAALSRVLLRGAQPHLLLLTDGEPSVGLRSGPELIALAQAAQRQGITVSTAGVGSRYDTELLAQMAEAGAGAFHHLPTADLIASVLMRELDGIAAAAASDVALYVTPAAEMATVELVHRLPTQHKDGALRVQVGEVVGGAERTALLLARGKGDELGTVRVTFEEPDGGSQLVAPRTVRVGAGGDAGRKQIALEWLHLKVADALDRGWHLAVAQRLAQAVATLEEPLVLAGRLSKAGYAGDGLSACIQRVEETRALMARADAERAELDAARRADRAFSHGTQVSRVVRRDD